MKLLDDFEKKVSRIDLFDKAYAFVSLYDQVHLFLMTLDNQCGIGWLGTGKLDKFISSLGTTFGMERKFEQNFYDDTHASTIINQFCSSGYEKEIEKLRTYAFDLARTTRTHVLLIIVNDDGRKFIFVSERLKDTIYNPSVVASIESAVAESDI